MEDHERIALEKREKADAARREREEATRLETERRRAENERLNRERRERIDAAERERHESLAAARRGRDETLARARAERDILAHPVAPAPVAPEAALPVRPEPAPPVAPVTPVAAAAPAPPVAAAPKPSPPARPTSRASVLPPSDLAARARTAVSRAMRAALLDRKTYEEIEADPTATVEAGIIVAVGALAGAVGTALWFGGTDPVRIAGDVGAGVLAWAAYAFAAYAVGTTILRGKETKADWGEAARTLGFASAPRVLLVVGPGFVGFVWLWMLATTVVAVRAALDVSTRRAVAIAVVAWLALSLAQAVATGVARGLAPGG